MSVEAWSPTLIQRFTIHDSTIQRHACRRRERSSNLARTMNETNVPLISSGVAGPLGVVHLPRLWQKVSLEARGKLASGYPGIGKGFDTMVITALGLNPEAVQQFISDQRPTYPQFEAWVKKQPGAKLDKANIDQSNAAV
ncbi:MAG: DUF5069 domain-containing protein, partial [Verrucomicrobiota bacterium]|nr:DUF5069 domain-containing protein [Verrucomicrobiota bacterium]